LKFNSGLEASLKPRNDKPKEQIESKLINKYLNHTTAGICLIFMIILFIILFTTVLWIKLIAVLFSLWSLYRFTQYMQPEDQTDRKPSGPALWGWPVIILVLIGTGLAYSLNVHSFFSSQASESSLDFVTPMQSQNDQFNGGNKTNEALLNSFFLQEYQSVSNSLVHINAMSNVTTGIDVNAFEQSLTAITSGVCPNVNGLIKLINEQSLAFEVADKYRRLSSNLQSQCLNIQGVKLHLASNDYFGLMLRFNSILELDKYIREQATALGIISLPDPVIMDSKALTEKYQVISGQVRPSVPVDQNAVVPTSQLLSVATTAPAAGVVIQPTPMIGPTVQSPALQPVPNQAQPSGNELLTRFGPSTAPSINPGPHVNVGDVIAYLWHGGSGKTRSCVYAPHVHFETTTLKNYPTLAPSQVGTFEDYKLMNGEFIDPEKLLQPRSINHFVENRNTQGTLINRELKAVQIGTGVMPWPIDSPAKVVGFGSTPEFYREYFAWAGELENAPSLYHDGLDLVNVFQYELEVMVDKEWQEGRQPAGMTKAERVMQLFDQLQIRIPLYATVSGNLFRYSFECGDTPLNVVSIVSDQEYSTGIFSKSRIVASVGHVQW
jgi:hypothetical protein